MPGRGTGAGRLFHVCTFAEEHARSAVAYKQQHGAQSASARHVVTAKQQDLCMAEMRSTPLRTLWACHACMSELLHHMVHHKQQGVVPGSSTSPKTLIRN